MLVCYRQLYVYLTVRVHVASCVGGKHVLVPPRIAYTWVQMVVHEPGLGGREIKREGEVERERERGNRERKRGGRE